MRAGIVAIGLLTFAAGAFAQKPAPKKNLRPFVPPPSPAGYLLGGLIAKDAGCARDLAKAETMNGLEQRKYVAELVSFECISILMGAYFADTREPIVIKLADGKSVTYWHALLTRAIEITESIYGPNRSPGALAVDCWIRDGNLMTIFPWQMKTLIREAAQNTPGWALMTADDRILEIVKRGSALRPDPSRKPQ